ncbi:DoxX family membrane protein [Haloglomus litoreum]|uniref:DoxX family membrane protein n=1 Tax=Haloglomus litoreum TaxID=3034026 RepID=UPI0023E7DA06|nr:DoxX family membrane protein [Haloglomus sp. DT116]
MDGRARPLGALVERAAALAGTAPPTATIARVGLGLMILLAGVHKLLAPGAWAYYVVDWLAPFLVLTPVEFMLVNGWLELAFGLAIIVDRYTAFAAAVAALSLTATVGYLTVVWATAGRFGDVLARDVGLAGLAWAVLVEALRSPE